MLFQTLLLNLNQWYHVTFTFNTLTDSGKIYINGNLDNKEKAQGLHTFQNCPLPLTIGAGKVIYGNYLDHFKGYIDEVKIYNYEKIPTPISKTPVIFIPGIMGSALYDDTNNDDHLTDFERIWIHYARIFLGNLDELQLDQSGEEPLDPVYNIKVAPLRNDSPNNLKFQYDYQSTIEYIDKLPFSTYRGFFEGLQNNPANYKIDDGDTDFTEGENLFCFVYDWRKKISWNAFLLSEFINNVLIWTGANKVNVVAHSLGGLVVKQFIKDYSSDPI